jgi:dienelactone hydrolase
MIAKYIMPLLIGLTIGFWVLAILLPVNAATFIMLRDITFGIFLFYTGILLGMLLITLTQYKNIEYGPLKKERFELTLSDNVKLHGAILSADDDASKPVILACHGWNALMEQLHPIIYPLVVQGYKVVYYNHRGHGKKPFKSEGNKAEIDKALVKDVREVIDFIESRPDLNHQKLGAIGFSLGGFTLLTGGYLDPRLKVVIACCAGHDMVEVHRSWPWYMRFFFRASGMPIFPPDEFNRKISPRYYLGTKVEKVVCLAHAKNDRVVPFENYLKNKELLKLSDEQTLSFEQGDHGFFGQEPVLISQIIRWFNKYLQ